MYAIQELEGDIPIEVHLFFNHGIKARNLKPEWISHLNSELYPQGTIIDYDTGLVKYSEIHSYLKGPFFDLKKGKEITEEIAQTMTLWHGGRNLQFNHMEMIPVKKGRWEYGPGLYLTTHYETARKYARGGGNTYKVTVEKGKDISNITIPLNEAIDFVNRYVKKDYRRIIVKDLINNVDRVGVLNLQVLVNLCVNDQCLTPKNTISLRKFLVDHGADYDIVSRYNGRDESIVVIYNPQKIKKIEIVKSSSVTLDQREQHIY